MLERLTWERNWGEPPANSQKGSEALSPTPLKEFNFANVSLEEAPFPVELSDENSVLANILIAAYERPPKEDPTNPSPGP